jgi:hypothetical protein
LNSKNDRSLRNVVAGSLLVLAGAAAWILLSAGQAGALTNVDQDSTNVNIGVGVSNTGGNAAVGNGSTNNATVIRTPPLPAVAPATKSP